MKMAMSWSRVLLPSTGGQLPVSMQISERLVLIFILVTLDFIGQIELTPMEEREQAKHLYKKARENDSLGPTGQADVRRTVRKLIQKSLNQDCRARFPCTEFQSIIEKTARSGKFVAHKTSAAFLLLEKYLILLVTFPWKTEFHKLKVSSQNKAVRANRVR